MAAQATQQIAPSPTHQSPPPRAPDSGPAARGARSRAPHHPAVPLSSVLDDLDGVIAKANGNPLSLAEIELALKGRGVAILLLVLAVPSLFPIPIPLLGAVIALPMIIVGLRIAIARDSRLPKSLRARQISSESLTKAARRLRKVVKPIAWLFRPRLGIMFWIVPWHLTGVSIALAATVLALPLPIPFTNTFPALALIHLALGLLQRDGIAICVGHALTLSSFVYLYFVWAKVVDVFQWITG